MDDKLLRKVNRQLRMIKLLLSFYFILIIGALAILGFIAYKVVAFTNQVNTKIDNLETKTSQDLNLKSQLCGGSTNYLTSKVCE